MKKLRALMLSACLAFVSLPALAGERVSLDEVPEPAREVIEAYVGDGTIDEIERDTDDGRTVYEVEYRTAEGVDHDLEVAEDGTILKYERD